MNRMRMTNPQTLGPMMGTSLRATVLDPPPPPPPLPAPPRSMASIFQTLTTEERKEMFSILVRNGYSRDQPANCGGCGARSRNTKCPCGYQNHKRERKIYYDSSGDDSSDDGDVGGVRSFKRVKRQSKPNSKYIDVTPAKTRKPPMKACPSCETPCHTAKTQCSKCGHSFPRKSRAPKQEYAYFPTNSFSSLDDKDKDSAPKRLCPSCHGWVFCSARTCDCGFVLHLRSDKLRSEQQQPPLPRKEPEKRHGALVQDWNHERVM